MATILLTKRTVVEIEEIDGEAFRHFTAMPDFHKEFIEHEVSDNLACAHILKFPTIMEIQRITDPWGKPVECAVEGMAKLLHDMENVMHTRCAILEFKNERMVIKGKKVFHLIGVY